MGHVTLQYTYRLCEEENDENNLYDDDDEHYDSILQHTEHSKRYTLFTHFIL